MLGMASKADDLLAFVEFVIADRTQLVFLGQVQILGHTAQFCAEPLQQTLLDSFSLSVHWGELFRLMFGMVLFSFLYDGLELSISGKLIYTIRFMFKHFLNVFDIPVADQVIFELLILTMLYAFVTAQSEDCVSQKHRNPEHQKNGVLQDVDEQNWDQVCFFQN